MNPAHTTTLLILLSVAIIPPVWIAWDVIAYRRGGQAATETATIRRWSHAHMIIPWGVGWVVGFLTCHFWATPL